MDSNGQNALFVAIPLLLVLVASMLRADEFFSTSEKRKKPSDGRRRFSVMDKEGREALTDPDGEPFGGEAGPGAKPADSLPK
jgi:hypothetical protein